MGGNGCDDIPSYVSLFSGGGVSTTEVANVTSVAEVAGVDGGVRGATRRARSDDVAAARAGKKVDDGSTRNLSEVQVGTKRSARGSPRDKQSGGGAAGGSTQRKGRVAREGNVQPVDRAPELAEGVDHSFSYTYGESDVMFTGDPQACGDLAAKIRGDFAEFPAVDSLHGKKMYREATVKHFQAMAAWNRLTGFYEEAYRGAEVRCRMAKREKLQQQKLLTETQERVKRLEDELALSKEKFDAEQKRLRESRAAVFRAEKKKAAGLRGRINRLVKHILGFRAREPTRLMLSQVKGTKECMEAVVTQGIEPSSTLPRLEVDLATYKAELDALVLPPLPDEDLLLDLEGVEEGDAAAGDQ